MPADSRRRDAGDDSSAADPYAVARAICLRLLSAQPRTRTELDAALRRRHVPADVAAEVLGRFTDVGLIDDEAFAAAWVQSRHAGRGLARRALASELRKRGVDDDLVADAVAAIDADAERETARTLVRRRLAVTTGLAPETRIRRLVAMLARKGYAAGVAYRVVREELDRLHEREDVSSELEVVAVLGTVEDIVDVGGFGDFGDAGDLRDAGDAGG